MQVLVLRKTPLCADLGVFAASGGGAPDGQWPCLGPEGLDLPLASPVRISAGWTCAPLRYMDGRPPGAGKFAISMGNAQEGVWLLVISVSYPRQTLP